MKKMLAISSIAIALLILTIIGLSVIWEKINESQEAPPQTAVNYPESMAGFEKIIHKKRLSEPNESINKAIGSGIDNSEGTTTKLANFPKIASWLAKKEDIISSQKPYDLVMSGWFTPEEAAALKKNNPDVIILAGLSYNWIWDNSEWKSLLLNVANHGRNYKIKIAEEMYLLNNSGEKCAFGWESKEWGQEEIYAMDPGNEKWSDLIASFYKNVLDQPQHDGIIVDMVTEKSWCKGAISDQQWVEATKKIMQRVKELNISNKIVVFNSGRNLSEIDEYEGFFDGYLMENFMGEQIKSTFDEGLEAADSEYIIIYAVDTDDTGRQNLDKMRLGLTLSLLKDNTYFAYDLGPRDHGQAWWFAEYNLDLGNPLGDYYEKGGSYMREFEKGIVISSPNNQVTGQFNEEHTDITTGIKSNSYFVKKGDGRIFSK